MSISIIDILAVAFIILVAFFSAEKGLFRVIIRGVAYVAAFVLSKISSPYVSQFVYEKLLKAKVVSTITEFLNSCKSSVFDIKQIFPEKALKIAEHFNFVAADGSAGRTIDALLDAEKIQETYIKPLSEKILGVFLDVLIFVFFSAVLLLIANFINKMLFNRKSGAVSSFNRFLGFLFGIIKAAVPVAVICEVLNLISPLINNQLLTKSVDSSYICGLLTQFINKL